MPDASIYFRIVINCMVAAVPEDVGIAGALQAIAHHLTANDILSSTYLLIMFVMLEHLAGAEVEKDIRIQKSIPRERESHL
ncbi:hypothetical protein D5086_018026 [Populus alba]|uniref:Uncharacterized protein n=1 Tax=Populus alba TaxID=43335 RepID=A0ACC4BQ76_POPAL